MNRYVFLILLPIARLRAVATNRRNEQSQRTLLRPQATMSEGRIAVACFATATSPLK